MKTAIVLITVMLVLAYVFTQALMLVLAPLFAALGR